MNWGDIVLRKYLGIVSICLLVVTILLAIFPPTILVQLPESWDLLLLLLLFVISLILASFSDKRIWKMSALTLIVIFILGLTFIIIGFMSSNFGT